MVLVEVNPLVLAYLALTQSAGRHGPKEGSRTAGRIALRRKPHQEQELYLSRSTFLMQQMHKDGRKEDTKEQKRTIKGKTTKENKTAALNVSPFTSLQLSSSMLACLHAN